MKKCRSKCAVVWLLITMVAVTGCNGSNDDDSRQVVVYTSVDRHYSEPVFNAFEAETGIEVLALYDVEATKTTGLVTRLIAEKERPQADVFWNGEIMQTVKLAQEGVLQPYEAEGALGLPDTFVGDDHLWTAFGGRSRVILVNTDRVAPEDYPTSLDDMKNPVFDRVMAKPFFGTTATHMTALYQILGETAYDYLADLEASGIRIVDGNSAVRDAVAAGSADYGLTDTDDAAGALRQGSPVAVVFPDRDTYGTLVIPNSVGLIAGCSHEEEGKAFIEYLLKEETMVMLMEMDWCQVSVRNIYPENPLYKENPVLMQVSYEQLVEDMDDVMADMKELFLD